MGPGTGETRLRIALLGPLEVRQDSGPVDLSSSRLRALLAVLALSAGETVSVEQLALVLWSEDPPVNQRRSVQTYISRLRGELGSDVIRTTPEGYRLDVEPDRVDALRFRRLLGEATLSRGAETERKTLEEALALWRGRPFDGVDSAVLCGPKAEHLVELHLSAVERLVDLSLEEGRHHELVADVRELAARHPLRETLWGRLLVLLDRCGRQAEALAMYERLRHRLVEDLGADPSPDLRRIHSVLLGGDAGQAERRIPRQLPAGVAGFVGRDDALKAMDRLLDGDTRICVVTGTAGVGKTALALHWAHQAGERFRDGQLYVDLQGFGPSEVALRPKDALSALLQSMGVQPQRIPQDLGARSALYRTMLAGKRMLVVLDNARDAEQVRRLLPGGAECTVLITSRRGLSSLVSAEGATLLTLDVLDQEEARDLLAHRLGRERIETDPASTDEIIRLCARLPLALAIAAGRAAANPSFSLATVAAGLRRAWSDVSALATRDAVIDLRSVLSRSYDLLPADAARLFRLLAVHPGPDLTLAAAASLAGLDPSHAGRLLDTLVDAHLVSEVAPGRFAFHALLRAYARGLARDADAHTRRRAARRMIEHYVHTACRAASLLEPAAGLPAPKAPEAPVTCHRQALAWFRAEQGVLLAVLRQAMVEGFDSHVGRLAPAVAAWCELRGDRHGKIAVQRIALAAAERSDDPAARARAHQGLATALIELGGTGGTGHALLSFEDERLELSLEQARECRAGDRAR
ncbi:AfsR/SARP family transcriptional regulator [Nonomuraea sp. SYSU D8015]|uniref:AfsR/SARP family transcriptional regulator n=1 Tax=Nonomuraea sp. SYSU D8015 TaxID=2593644 RepID=UPI0016603C21|nr:AfsR/SARP family transcriptional regulator [Nonomuraea sp. SYSU D8015]